MLLFRADAGIDTISYTEVKIDIASYCGIIINTIRTLA